MTYMYFLFIYCTIKYQILCACKVNFWCKVNRNIRFVCFLVIKEKKKKKENKNKNKNEDALFLYLSLWQQATVRQIYAQAIKMGNNINLKILVLYFFIPFFTSFWKK